jgi:hypothetical protein
MPAKDFGSASTIDHINRPKDLCETKPILSGSPAHATTAKTFGNQDIYSLLPDAKIDQTATVSSTGLYNKEPYQQGRCQTPAPKALAAGSMPAKDFGSASAIDHINSPKGLCETRHILSGSSAHATTAKKFANHTRSAPAQNFANQATSQPPQHPTDQEKLLELEKLYETALERYRFALERYNEAFAKSKKTPQDLAHKQLQELYEELYENMTPDEQEFFEENSSLITSQELCRQHELQVLYEELYEDMESEEQQQFFLEDCGHNLTSQELYRQMELQEFYEQIYDQIEPEDTPTSQDLAHEQLQELYEEIYYENMTPDEQCFFQDVSSQITSQELCRQMELQELYEDHCFYEDIDEPDEGHVLTSPELRRQMELQELYEQIYDQIEPTCDEIDPKNHAFYTSTNSNDQECLSDESYNSSNFSNEHGYYSDASNNSDNF